jgi:hypothetical protein
MWLLQGAQFGGCNAFLQNLERKLIKLDQKSLDDTVTRMLISKDYVRGGVR